MTTERKDCPPGSRWIVSDSRLSGHGREIEVVNVYDDCLEWKYVDEPDGQLYGTTSMAFFLFSHQEITKPRKDDHDG